jgi:hypothetical protein
MFYEIDPELIKQVEDAQEKRWFRDAEAECDLLVWLSENNEISRFQFWHYDALVEWDSLNGLKTGLVNKDSGAFTHYQSQLYRLHQDIDEEILSAVKNILIQKVDEDDRILSQIKNILYKISNQSEA